MTCCQVRLLLEHVGVLRGLLGVLDLADPLTLRRVARNDEDPAEAGSSWGGTAQLELPPKFLKRWLNFSTRPAESMMRCLPV